METISNCWIPGYRGRHLPVPVVPRSQRYPRTSCSRRYGDCRSSIECGVGKITIHLKRKSQLMKVLKLPKTLSTFLHGQTPTCPFLPQDHNTKTSPTVGHEVSPTLPTLLNPLALSASKNQKDECERCLQNSTKGQVDSSYPSHIAPYWSGAKSSKERCSLLKSTLNLAGGILDREIVQKEILSRLKAVEAAAGADKNCHWAPIISENGHHERLQSADLNDMSNQLAVEDKKWIKLAKGLKGPLRETDNQLEHDHNQFTAGTRSGLKHCLPSHMDRLGFQFPKTQDSQRAARVNLTVSCPVSYLVGTKRGSEVTGDHDVQLDDAGILDSGLKSCCRKAGGFPMPVGCWTSPKSLSTRKMGRMIQGRGGQMKRRRSRPRDGQSGRFLDTTSHLCGGSGGTLGAGSRLLVRNIDGTARRLWSRADYEVEAAGNLFKDWLKIVGLIALVISGTYAFSPSHRYLNPGFDLERRLLGSLENRRSKGPIALIL